MSGNDWWNRNVFSCCQKEETDGADCTSLGRLFRKMEAAIRNERRPAVDRRYCGTCSCSVNDDGRRRRPGRLDTGTSHPCVCDFSRWLLQRPIGRVAKGHNRQVSACDAYGFCGNFESRSHGDSSSEILTETTFVTGNAPRSWHIIVFQQDSPTAQRARGTIEFLMTRNTRLHRYRDMAT